MSNEKRAAELLVEAKMRVFDALLPALRQYEAETGLAVDTIYIRRGPVPLTQRVGNIHDIHISTNAGTL